VNQERNFLVEMSLQITLTVPLNKKILKLIPLREKERKEGTKQKKLKRERERER